MDLIKATPETNFILHLYQSHKTINDIYDIINRERKKVANCLRIGMSSQLLLPHFLFFLFRKKITFGEINRQRPFLTIFIVSAFFLNMPSDLNSQNPKLIPL